MHVHCLLGLKNMTYERVKPATTGPVANINKLKMNCLFYFVLESEKIAIMSGLKWYLKNYSIFPLFILFFLYFNSKCESRSKLMQAPNNDLLMDELNAIYFAPKWWLHVIIWLPRTTDISTYFAQSLEIEVSRVDCS